MEVENLRTSTARAMRLVTLAPCFGSLGGNFRSVAHPAAPRGQMAALEWELAHPTPREGAAPAGCPACANPKDKVR